MKTFCQYPFGTHFDLKPHRFVFIATGEGGKTERIQEREKQKEKPEDRLARLTVRYITEREEELKKCKDDPSKEGRLKKMRIETETRDSKQIVKVNVSTGRPEFMTMDQVIDNLRKFYAIMGRNWDDVQKQEAGEDVKKDEAAKKEADKARQEQQEEATLVEFQKWFKGAKEIKKSTDTVPVGKYRIDNVEPGRGAPVVIPKIYIPGSPRPLEATYSRVSGTRVTQTEVVDPTIIDVDGVAYAHIKGGRSNDRDIENGWVEISHLRKPNEGPVEVVKAPKAAESQKEAPEKNPEVRKKVDEAVKGVFDMYANMTPDELKKNQPPLNVKRNLLNVVSDRLVAASVTIAGDLGKIEGTNFSKTFSPVDVAFNKHGISVDNLSYWADQLYGRKGVTTEDEKTPEGKAATEVIKKITLVLRAVREKCEDPNFLTQNKITKYDQFLQKVEGETTTAVGALLTPQVLAKVRFDKLPDKQLTYPLGVSIAQVIVTKEVAAEKEKPKIRLNDPLLKEILDRHQKPALSPDDSKKATEKALTRTIAQDIFSLNPKTLGENNIKNREDLKKYTTRKIESALRDQKFSDGTYNFVDQNFTVTVKNGRSSVEITEAWLTKAYEKANPGAAAKEKAPPVAKSRPAVAAIKGKPKEKKP